MLWQEHIDQRNLHLKSSGLKTIASGHPLEKVLQETPFNMPLNASSTQLPVKINITFLLTLLVLFFYMLLLILC